MKAKDIGILFLLAALWGASFLFMRIVSPVLGPFLTIELRVLIAGIVLLLYTAIIKHPSNFRERWRQYMVIGALNAAIPFTLIATATLTLNASLAAVLNSTTPLFAALVAWGWLKEKLTARKIFGVMIGVSGVVILLGWSPIPLSFQVILSASLSILAAVSYAFAGVYAKRTFTGVDSLSIAIGQQMAAALLLLPITLTKIPSVHVSGMVVFAVIGLAVLCTAIAYLLYFYLIESVGPTKTLSVTFLIPLFGVIWGIVFLKEQVTTGMIIGLLIILSSVFMISEINVKSMLPTENKSVR
ncbi:MAG: DMT family transporter [Bacillota bacterium]